MESPTGRSSTLSSSIRYDSLPSAVRRCAAPGVAVPPPGTPSPADDRRAEGPRRLQPYGGRAARPARGRTRGGAAGPCAAPGPGRVRGPLGGTDRKSVV